MDNSSTPLFSICTCCVSERQELKDTVSRIYDTCDHSSVREFIIVYAKISPYGYADFLESLKKDFPDFTFIIKQQRGDGLNPAAFEAFSAASGDCIIGLAADGENRPEDVAEIMRLYRETPERIITASRRIHENGFDRYPRDKKILNDIFYFILHRFLGMRQTDVTYFFQGTPGKILDRYFSELRPESFVTDICLLPELHDVPFSEFPSPLGNKLVERKTNLGLGYYIGTCRNICFPLIKKRLKRIT